MTKVHPLLSIYISAKRTLLNMYKPLHDKTKIISESDQEIHNHALQTNPRPREEKQKNNNNHESSERQLK